jgi:hypothetical protein
MSKSRKYIIKKARKRSEGFPIGTIAYYGPTDQFASKVAVSVIDQHNNQLVLKRWFTTGQDVRTDEAILLAIMELFEEHGVYRVAMMERIIGCPHEEGIDYPKGETCPECPFWIGRDRWTGELLQ